ncbi:MAG: GHKL domain-containing protein, partial [Eubacteriales bacterium]|nr:GHKL domain-containing protein [Eubacteriales bacterium]
MLYYVLAFLSFLQSVIGFTLISSSVMLIKEPIKRRIVMGLSVMIFGISLLSYLLYSLGTASVERVAVLFILGIELSWFLICSGDRFFVSLFSFLTFVNVYVSIGFFGDTFTVGLERSAAAAMLIVTRTIIYLIVIPLLFKFVRPRFRNLVEALDQEWRTAFLVPLIFLILQIVVLYYPQAYWHWALNDWSRIIIVTVYVLFMAVYYLLYIQAHAIVEKYALEKRQLLMAQQEKLWEAELIRQKETAILAAKQRHDLHHHNTVVMGLLQSGEIEKLQRYMKSFDSTIDVQNSRSYCINPIANSIMNYYAFQAESKNIKTSFDVNIPDNIGIDPVDLTCILGNALENALEACLRLPTGQEKEIMVKAIYLDHRLRVRVENTCDTDVPFAGELPVTNKVGGGTGTRSILYTAERYDGTAGFMAVDGQFIAQIVLNEK